MTENFCSYVHIAIGVVLLNFSYTVDTMRETFMLDVLNTHGGMPRCINRNSVYEDVFRMYQKELDQITTEFPFRIEYLNERAIDTGGVCRDMFSSFWEEAYVKHFDGDRLLIPAVNANSEIANFSILGVILAHGFFACNFLPVRLAFPIIAMVLYGPNVNISENILLESLLDFVTVEDGKILQDAATESLNATINDFQPDIKSRLIEIFSNLGCTAIPSPSNIKQHIINIAKYQFILKPLGTIYTLRSRVPEVYQEFWKQVELDSCFSLYQALNASPSRVLQLIDEPVLMNASESRVYYYLVTFVRNMKPRELRLFLRFVTGSSVMLKNHIMIHFNSLSGLARRPISHTCNCTLELSISYATYPEFEKEFLMIFQNELSWSMDAI